MAIELQEALDRFLGSAIAIRKDQTIRPLEKLLRLAMAGLFRDQGASFLRAFGSLRPYFEEAPRPRDWEILWERTAAANAARMRKVLDSAYRSALNAGAGQGIRSIGLDISFDLKNPRAAEWLRDRAADRVTRINQETKRQLRTVLEHAGRGGWSYDRTAKLIKQRFEGFAGPPLRGGPREITSRAMMVAVTEVGDAYEAGNRAVADDLRDAGVPMEKRWLPVGDARVCASCGGNHAEGWIPLAQPFSSGDNEPLGHPGCRCTCEYQPIAGAELPKPGELPEEEKVRLRNRKSNTPQEAEERARALLGPDHQVGFAKLPPAQTDEIADSLERLFAEYPEVAAKLTYIGDARWLYKTMAKHGRMSPRNMAEAFAPVGLRRGGIAFADKQVSEIGWRMGNFHPPTIKGPVWQEVAHHEFGHHLYFSLKYEDRLELEEKIIAALDKLGSKASRANALNTAKVKENLSGYAMENWHEFVAEAFAEYKLGASPRPLARLVGEFLDGKLKP